MDEKITIQDLIQRTAELQELFRKIENRPWTINTFAIELTAEVGTLADGIMIKDVSSKLRSGQKPVNLEDAICDVLFVVFMIADYYEINIEQSYLSMIDSTRRKLKAENPK